MSTQPDSRYLPTPITPITITPVTLEGRFVRLEPLSLEHHAGLCKVALVDDIWRWMPVLVRTPDDMRRYIEQALRLQSAGSALPFATIVQPENRVVGSSRFMNIDAANRRVEIGSTFIGGPWQRTPVNTEAKLLMLSHAFETLGCIRVELKTDVLNERSRSAILRLGARQEGIFRNHVICSDGRIRDSVYFSITDTDWPAIKANLEEKLSRPFTTP